MPSIITGNEPKNLRIVAALTSTILMLSVAFDLIRYIDWNFLSAFTFTGSNLQPLIFIIFLMLAIIFWILSILNEQLSSAITFLLFLSLSIAGTYIYNPVTSNTNDGNLTEPLILVSLSLLFVESIARLQQSKKRFEANKQVTDRAMAIKTDSILNFYLSKMEDAETIILSKVYHGSGSLRIFKIWLVPSFIFLTFIGIVAIILTAPDYIIQKFDLSGISQDRLKYYLATFVILLLLVGILIINSIVKKVYSSIAVGESEKGIEVANLYNKFIRSEKIKSKKHTTDWTRQNKVLARVKYIAIAGLIIAFSASNMNTNQVYDATSQFFNPSLDYQEHTFLNELNEKIIDIEKNIYDIDEIIAELNEAIWS